MSSISDKPGPIVLHITVADVVEAFGEGLRDFQALPLYDIGLGAVNAIGGLVIVYSIAAFGMSYLAYPLAAGFALIAPFVAAGFYELSRQREYGQPPSAREALTAIISSRELGWMAFVTIFVFIVWMYLLQFLVALFLGLHASYSTLQAIYYGGADHVRGVGLFHHRQLDRRRVVPFGLLADRRLVSAPA
jgi:uncharacterized membrane protein